MLAGRQLDDDACHFSCDLYRRCLCTPCYIMPFGEVLLVQIAHKWYHIKAEITTYISYATYMEVTSIFLMLGQGIDGWRALYLSAVVIRTRLDHVLARAR